MIRSMTAYGRAKQVVGGKNILVELKSVNNRYFDCSVKISRMYGFLEDRVKTYIMSQGISRGKMDVFVGVEAAESSGSSVVLDNAYAKSYLAALYHLRDTYALKDDITVSSVAQNHDLFLVQKPEEDMERDWADIQVVLGQAVAQFLLAREREGANLARDIAEKKERIAAYVPVIEEKSQKTKEGYHDKLTARLRQVLEDNRITIDENRILTECAIYADKIAVDEETVRLRSHFDAFDEMLQSAEPVGRKLDFLLQEMNRETNTIGSKCADLEISRLVIDMKAELEKIREQIQNIE